MFHDLVERRRMLGEVVEERMRHGVTEPSDPVPLVELVSSWVAEFNENLGLYIGGRPLGETAARTVGARLATLAHLELHTAANLASGQVDPSQESREHLVMAETRYLQHLSGLRTAAINSDLGRVGQIIIEIASIDVPGLLEVWGAAPAAQTSSVVSGFHRLTAARLSRKTAALFCAGALLQHRLSDGGLKYSTAGIAARRSDMQRRSVEMPLMSLTGLEPGARIALLGFVVDATWIDRPGRPYTRLQLANGSELRVHFRNVTRVGLLESQWVLGRCKVEAPDRGTEYAVAEFEGPSGTANRVWEDWLHDETRDWYDTAPRSVDFVWDFPTSRSPRLDLTARLNREDDKEVSA